MNRVVLASFVVGVGVVLSAQTPEIPLPVRIDEVNRRAAREPGLLVVVEGTVVGPFGPRLFAIRDSRFLDPDGDVLVAMAAPLAAGVTERVRVRVIGRLHPAVSHDDALGIPITPPFRERVPRLPLVLAQSVTGPDGAQLAMRVEARGQPVPLARAAAAREADLVGRWLARSTAHVLQTRAGGMFWVGPSSAPSPRLLVVPAAPIHVRRGDRVDLRGLLLRLPRGFANTLRDRNVTRDEPIYLYAADVQTTSGRRADHAAVSSLGGPSMRRVSVPRRERTLRKELAMTAEHSDAGGRLERDLVLPWFVCGLMTGVALTLLVTPVAGRDTRQWIVRTGGATRRRTAAILERNRDALAVIRKHGVLGLARQGARRVREAVSDQSGRAQTPSPGTPQAAS